MPNPITMIEEIIPKLKEREEFDTTPNYLNYVIDTINEARENNKLEDGRVKELVLVETDLSPVYKIIEIFKNKPLSDQDIKEVMVHAKNINAIKNSLCQRGTSADKLHFYTCWSLYEQGLSWREIFEITDEQSGWDTEDFEGDIKKRMQKWKNRFNWQRKQA